MQLHVRPQVMVSLSMVAALAVLSGCAAVHTSIAKKDLDVQTKMSDTVFLDPVGPDKKTIFVQLRNTSDRPFDIEGPIVNAIAARGYRVTQDPEAAHPLLHRAGSQGGSAVPEGADRGGQGNAGDRPHLSAG